MYENYCNELEQLGKTLKEINSGFLLGTPSDKLESVEIVSIEFSKSRKHVNEVLFNKKNKMEIVKEIL